MSSKRARRRKECERKKRYESREAAEIDARCLAHKTGHRFNVYTCKWCQGIHVGHLPKRVLQAIRERQEASHA